MYLNFITNIINKMLLLKVKIVVKMYNIQEIKILLLIYFHNTLFVINLYSKILISNHNMI